jgi:hypothetical protein
MVRLLATTAGAAVLGTALFFIKFTLRKTNLFHHQDTKAPRNQNISEKCKDQLGCLIKT